MRHQLIDLTSGSLPCPSGCENGFKGVRVKRNKLKYEERERKEIEVQMTEQRSER